MGRFSQISVLCLLLCFGGYQCYGMAERAFLEADMATLRRTLTDGKYDRALPPMVMNNQTGQLGPVKVGVTMYVTGMQGLDTVRHTLTLDLYFRQIWKDPRLANIVKQDIVFSGSNTDGLLDRIWRPDTFFANGLEGKEHSIASPNLMLRLMPDGGLLYSVRLTQTLSCPMDLSHYPHQKMICAFEIESYGHSMATMDYDWAKGDSSVGMTSGLSTPYVSVDGVMINKKIEMLSTGNYSRLVANFQFRSAVGPQYFLRLYLPSAAICTLSWLVFWLPPVESRFERLGLVVLASVAMLVVLCKPISMNDPTMEASTNVSTLADLWRFVCAVFSVALVVQYGAVAVLVGRAKQAMNSSGDSNKIGYKPQEPFLGGISYTFNCHSLYHRLAQWIDIVARVLFPVCFFMFTIYFKGLVMRDDEIA